MIFLQNRAEKSMIRRVGAYAVLLAGTLALGACGSISDALDGINPISRTLDSSAKKKSASRDYRQPLAIPPDYSLRPPAGKVATRETRDAESKAADTEGKATATVKSADPTKIDLGASSSGEKVNSKTINSSTVRSVRSSTGKVVREGRVETRGKAIVKDGERSKGEDELLRRSTKKGS